MIPLPIRKYNVIYADPPWEYRRYSGSVNKGRNAAEHYNVLSLEEIKALPISSLASDHCILFLWATNPLIQDALDVIKAWGFEYKTVGFVWVKYYKEFSPLSTFNNYQGMGFYTKSATEPCLLATKGQATKLVKSNTVFQVVKAPLSGKHSTKPSAVRERIVKLVGDVPRIELFARHKIRGWDQWGLEVPKEQIELESFLPQ